MWEVDSKTGNNNFEPFPEFGTLVQQTVMPIVTLVENHLVPLGTGFMIGADGLMLTASHVLDEGYRTGHRRIGPDGAYQTHWELYAIYATDEMHHNQLATNVGGLWPIDRIWRPEELDISLCWLRPAVRNGQPMRFPIVRLSPGAPAVGAPIAGIGYYAMEGGEVGDEGDGNQSITYKQNTATTRGCVVEVYLQQRDAGMLSFPSFQTDARFDHGMSGGPIFNALGTVCGVICSSSPQLEDGQGHISYGSLIWPIFGITFEAALEPGGELQAITIAELTARQVIQVDNSYECVRVVQLEDGKRTVEYAQRKKA
jgi:hypothetical protein